MLVAAMDTKNADYGIDCNTMAAHYRMVPI
jgi:hypothetical protein